jgi:hypothetical protein
MENEEETLSLDTKQVSKSFETLFDSATLGQTIEQSSLKWFSDLSPITYYLSLPAY